MVERKIILKKCQAIISSYFEHINNLYNQDIIDDEERDNLDNFLTDIERDFEELYNYYGFESNNDYSDLIEIHDCE